MATQDILVVYKAEVNQLTQQLDKIVAAQVDIIKGTEEANKTIAKNLTTQEFAAKKRAQLVKAEELEIKKLTQLRKIAYDPKLIEDYNKRIAASQKNIQLLSAQTQKSLGGVNSVVQSIGRGIALGIGAAFSVDAIINFSKASVNAFLEAEKNAQKLKFAITQIGGESEAVFDKLLEQSNELQKTTIFSDDSIQAAQAALSAFGLTGAEIDKLIPKLADFATVTGKSIEEAAQAVGQGLAGAGREFKKYSIEVTATASKQENLNKILSGFDQFAGAAGKATQTLAGQLAQATNRADELQESVGEKLAPAFVRARIAALEFAEQAVDFILNTDAAMIKLLKTLGLFPAAQAEVSDGFKSFTQEILKQVEAAEALGQKDEIALKLRNDQTKAIAEQQAIVDKLQQSKEVALSREVVNLEEVRAINQAISKQQETNLANEITKLNIIEEILSAQKKVRTEEKETSDVRVAGSAAEVQAIQRLSAEYSALFELLNDEQKARLIELSVTANIDAAPEIKKKIDELERLFKQKKIDIPFTFDEFGTVEELQNRFELLKGILESEGIEIPVSVNTLALENFRTEVAKLQIELSKGITVPVKLEVPEGRTDVEGVFPGQLTDDEIKQQQELNDQLLAQTEDLLGSTLELYNVYTNNRLQQIDKERDAKLDAIDAEQAAVNDLIENRRISETEAERLNKQLTEKRLATQAQADKKERALKRKAFDIDKAAALVKIAINTAVAVTENLGVPILAAFIAAAGAAEAAVVASQANPYEKGTKKSKKGLALVDEKGAELIQSGGRLTYLEQDSKVLPAKQTKTYGEVIDAMFDNRFEKYVMDKYVTPRLLAQKNKQESEKSKSFAQNMAQSITYNQIPQQTGNKLSNVNVTNYRELGDHIAHRLKKDIYRS